MIRRPATCGLVAAVAALSALSSSCGARGPSSAAPPGGAPSTWAYDVAVSADASELSVAATFPPGTAPRMTVFEGAEPFVKDVEVSAAGGGWKTAAPAGDDWIAAGCERGCRVRYRFLLQDAASTLESDDVAAAYHGLVESPPGAWLLRPLESRPGDRIRLHVRVPRGADVAFATGLRRAGEGEWEAPAREIGIAPYTVIGRVRLYDVALARAHLTLGIAPGKLSVDDGTFAAWAERAGRAVETFYGDFPIDRALIVVLPTRGGDVGFGRTMAGAGGGGILVNVGRDTTKEELDADWVAVHEMIHLAFPSVAREHLWIEEGLATYLEPVVRVRAGMMREDDAWRELVEMLPNGLPRAGDRGLDRTRTWGRVYWGGALYGLLADVEIRKRTNNAHGLDDAVRGILRAGGNDAAHWELERALEAGDRATGVGVLRDLHARMGTSPYPVDLDAVWRELGVGVRGRTVTYDEAAPFAAVRRAIFAP